MKRNHLGRSIAGLVVSLLAATALLTGAATAQDYPTKVIRIIVPFTPGGGNDIAARLIAPGLSEALGQPVIVENKPGASGNIGTEAAARSAPDGYTLLIASNTVTINPSLYAKLPFEIQRDFAPIGMIASVPMILVTNPKKQPYKTLAEFITYAKEHPKTINFSSPGSGHTPSTSPESFSARCPARRSCTWLTRALRRRSRMWWVVTWRSRSRLWRQCCPTFRADGCVRSESAGDRRASGLPDLPTFDEAGLKGYDAALVGIRSSSLPRRRAA